MASILLVRHAQASFGAADYDQLSENGLVQSVHLGEAFRRTGEPIDALWTGPMRRHRQTAQGVLKGIQAALEPTVLDGLAEFDHEEVIVRHEPRYADREAFAANLAMQPDPHAAFSAMFRGAMARWVGEQFNQDYRESWSVFQQRCIGALNTLARHTRPEQSVLVITSGGVISVIVQSLLGLSDEVTLETNWRLANASITRVNVDRQGRCSLHSLNEQAHFQGRHKHHLTWR